MAYLQILMLVLYQFLYPVTLQPVTRILTDNGASFRGVVSIGQPYYAYLSLFLFDTNVTTYRNNPGNQAYNERYMNDSIFGPVNQFKIAGQPFSLPFTFNPYYAGWSVCPDCFLAIGMGVGSPIWNAYANISFGQFGISFDEFSTYSNHARDNALHCDVPSTSVCDTHVYVRVVQPDGSASIVPSTVNGTRMKIGFGMDPVTYLPSDVYWAIRGTLTPSGSDQSLWPDVYFCDVVSDKCVYVDRRTLLMSFRSYGELTIAEYGGSDIVLGTSVAVSNQFFFFSRQARMGTYHHPFTLGLGAVNLMVALFEAVLFLFVGTTSLNINVNPLKPRTFSKVRIVVDVLAMLLMLPLLTNEDFLNNMMSETPAMLAFVAFSYALLLVLWMCGNFSSMVELARQDVHGVRERMDQAGRALMRNMTTYCAITFIIFLCSLEFYPGGIVELFQFASMGLYVLMTSVFTGCLAWYAYRLWSAEWGAYAILAALLWASTNVVGICFFITPYITQNLVGSTAYSQAIMAFVAFVEILVFIVLLVCNMLAYMSYINTGVIPRFDHDERAHAKKN